MLDNLLYRHGDVLVECIETLPPAALPRTGTTLARGEVTGHSHRFADAGSVQLFQVGTEGFIQVLADEASLIHEEHHTITLPRGLYRFWMQREYSPEAIRRVID